MSKVMIEIDLDKVTTRLLKKPMSKLSRKERDMIRQKEDCGFSALEILDAVDTVHNLAPILWSYILEKCESNSIKFIEGLK